MPNKCCVVGCTFGYKSNVKKVSLFRFPKDGILRGKWKKAIPRANLAMNMNTRICEKHFSAEEVFKTWESGNSPSKIMVNIHIYSLIIVEYYIFITYIDILLLVIYL